jgi:hypothetical protein
LFFLQLFITFCQTCGRYVEEFRLRHVDRRQTLELETQFLPNLPKSDYKVGGLYKSNAVAP